VFHAFLLARGVFASIDVPGALSTSSATARVGINAKGEIVGQYLGADGRVRGFLLNSDGFTTIDFEGVTATVATGINPEGNIVGNYRDLAGRAHGFLLRR
jgi:hypothetical protein